MAALFEVKTYLNNVSLHHALLSPNDLLADAHCNEASSQTLIGAAINDGKLYWL
jgi:hypothetical protein